MKKVSISPGFSGVLSTVFSKVTGRFGLEVTAKTVSESVLPESVPISIPVRSPAASKPLVGYPRFRGTGPRNRDDIAINGLRVIR